MHCRLCKHHKEEKAKLHGVQSVAHCIGLTYSARSHVATCNLARCNGSAQKRDVSLVSHFRYSPWHVELPQHVSPIMEHGSFSLQSPSAQCLMSIRLHIET